METIQVVLDKPLLQAANRFAKKAAVNRSALIRAALRSYLKELRNRESETQERRAYAAHPQDEREIALWEKESVWPDE